MKKLEKRILILFLLIATGVTAQIGVGTRTPHPDAMLEVASTNKGMLLPRVALTGTTTAGPLSAHVAGMTVYNTATSGDVTPGYYYNDGSKWVKLATGQGLKGDTGAQGPAGANGLDGAVGPKGDKGDTGAQGPAGAVGPKGDTGAAGAQGPIGLTGATGASGPKGDKGDTGAQGPAGAVGPKGDTGAAGPQGPIGLTGPAGATGAQGPIGLTGPAGPAGATGSQGIKGDKGDTGAQGPAGSNATVTGTAPISVASGVVSLADSGVTATKLATDAVETAKIKNAAVTVAKISATGTASATTFLRGDGTWATPAASLPALAVTNPTTDNYTVLETDAIIHRNITANATITFPTSIPAGKVFYIVNTSGSFNWQISPAPVNTSVANIEAGVGITLVTLGGGQVMVTSAY